MMMVMMTAMMERMEGLAFIRCADDDGVDWWS